jgi:hypothetical protein
MCYSVYFSTDSQEDFAAIESEHFRIFVLDPAKDSKVLGLLGYANRWYVQSQYGGCSCHFRHGMERGFRPVEDWCPEDADDVDATVHFYDFMRRLLTEGHQLDLLDIWEGTPSEKVVRIEVSLAEVARESFQFLDGTRLVLSL